MIKIFRLTILLIAMLSVCGLQVFAQDEATPASQPSQADAEQAAPENVDVAPSQEVEINEDNYRQFMELKDARQQRDILPENSYQSQAGLQKLDKLPEASQKHLRNQLREIIVQGDKWQPGDEDNDYPYVPSAAAMTDGDLQKQETEAWGELVDGYHKREAEMYARSSGTQSAGAVDGRSGDGSQSGQESGDGSPAGQESGDGGSGSEGASGSSSQQSRSGQSQASDSYSPDSMNAPDEQRSAGVSQNALEFLKKSGNQAVSDGNNNSAADMGSEGQNTANAGQNTARAGSPADKQSASGQPGAESQTRTASTPPAQNLPDETDTEDMQGTSQNALEYLTGGNDQQQTPDSVQDNESQQDTLSIQELLNAQGVLEATGGVSSSRPENDSDKDDPQKKRDDG